MVRSSIRVHGGLAINSVGPGFRVLHWPRGPDSPPYRSFSYQASLGLLRVVPVIVAIFLNKDSAPNTEITRTNRYLPPKRKGYIYMCFSWHGWILFTPLSFSRVSVFSSSPPAPLVALSFCSPALFVYSPTFARPRGEMEVSEIECVTACINIISRTIRHKFCHDRDII